MRKVLLCLLLVAGGVVSVHAENMDLGNIIVTPNRVAEDASFSSSNVSVIGRYDIEHSNAATVGEVLKRVPGVNVTNQGSAHSTLVDIGGYADAAVSNVLVLVNGRRTNSVDMSGPDWQQIPVDSIERIEVIRGGASVLYGDKASGGVVNIITKEGKGKDSVTLFSEVGSYRSQKYGVEASGSREKVSYYLYSDYADTKGYRDNSQIRTKDEQVRLSYRVNDQVKFGFEAGVHREDYGMPGSLTGSDLVTMDRRDTNTPNDYGDTADDFIRLSSELIPVDADGEYGRVAVDYAHRDRHTYALNDAWFFAQKGLIKSDAFNLKHIWEGTAAGRALNIVTGVDYGDDRNHVLTDGLGSSNDNFTITKRTLGFYNHSEIEALEHFFVDGGIRHESAKYIFDQYNTGAYTVQEPSVDAYSGGLKYEYAKGSNVFLNAQKTFRFLASDEWYQSYTNTYGDGTPPHLNRDLKQQTGMEYRAGVKHALNDLLEVSATPFLVLNKNEIFYDYPNSNSNYDHTRRKGVDLGAKLDVRKAAGISFLRSWDIVTNYTYMDAEFVGGPYAGKSIPRVPSHRVFLGMDVALANGLTWGLTGRWTGLQYMNNDTMNQFPRIKPFVVIDTKVAYKLRSNANIYVGINNLFDEKYNDYTSVGTTGLPYYYPAPERNYVVGMKYMF